MKKTMILAAFAALISLASCQKEEAINNGTDRNASPLFTASISGATRTTIDMTEGKVAWEATDEITVTDAASASSIYKIESIDATTGKATFVYKSGAILGAGPYTASYGTEPATAQTYSATAGKLYMTAPETSNNSFTFTVQCGLMKLNLTKTGESVKSITVTGTPTGGSETTYTLTCDPAQSVASAKDFFIALPAGSYTKIEITNNDGEVCTLNSASGVAVASNHIKPITFGESKIKFAPAIPDGALAGKFSVSPTKQVYFSQGNLTYNVSTTTWAFYEHQYDCATGYDSNLISLFTWGYGTWSTSPNGTYYQTGDFTDWGSQIGDGNTWRTLTPAEWQYLFNYGDYTNDVRNGKYKWAMVNGVNGYVIAPDDFSGELANTNIYADDAALADNNLVFLPAAGYRVGSNVINVGVNGCYWSSTAIDEFDAFNVYFNSNFVSPVRDGSRNEGSSVRLITECQ